MHTFFIYLIKKVCIKLVLEKRLNITMFSVVQSQLVVAYKFSYYLLQSYKKFSRHPVFEVMYEYLLLYKLLNQVLLLPLCLMKHHFIKTYRRKGEVAPLHTGDKD